MPQYQLLVEGKKKKTYIKLVYYFSTICNFLYFCFVSHCISCKKDD